MEADTLAKEDLAELVREHVGGDEFLLGFAGLHGYESEEFPDLGFAVSVGHRLDDEIIDEIVDGPTERYLEHYRRVNRTLNKVTRSIADLLITRGCRAVVVPATIDREPTDPKDPYFKTPSAAFPHKTAATLAGLGWIGKTALFVSDRFGPRVRLATVLTDCPLEIGTPCEMSLCGDCVVCVEACPVDAATGEEWFPGLEREQLLDASKCRKYCVKITESRTGHKGTVCGICMASCPVGIEFRTDPSEDEWF